MSGDPSGKSGSARIVSLDQFRGYTVLGMLLVNYLGSYASCPPLLDHHNTYCSYADTIMPQFLFAVGFAYRMVFLKRSAREGVRAAYLHSLRRCLGLILIGLVVYGLDGRAQSMSQLRDLGLWGFLTTAFQREPFQALVHIGVASLWALPVIGRRPWTQIAFAVGSCVAHVLISRAGYYDFAWSRPVIDGGPLGFLTWTAPLIAGSLTHDIVVGAGAKRAGGPLLVIALALMGLGYGLNCLGTAGLAPPPFVEPAAIPHPPQGPGNLWEMSQRAGTVSYLVFSAGFSMAVYVLFLVACDLGGLQIGAFRTFGTNALAAYVLHPMVFTLVKPYVPRDAPLEFALAGTALALGICYLLIRSLEKQKVFIRL